jgi:cation diffusion facilitator CzcD-associated flavoprotein CzcO
VHHPASASGLPVPSRTIALSPDTAIESWAPTRAVGLDIEVLEWIAGQIRGKLRDNPTVTNLLVAIIGAATLPLAQLPTGSTWACKQLYMRPAVARALGMRSDIWRRVANLALLSQLR